MPGLLDALSALVDRSLVVAEERDGRTRFRMLEPIRAAAAEALRARDEQAVPRARHVDWFARQAERAAPHLSARVDEVVQRLEDDGDNYREAIAHAIGDGRGHDAQRMAGTLWRFWLLQGRIGVGEDVLAQATLAEGQPTAARARCLEGLAYIALDRGEIAQARAAYEQARDTWASVGDDFGLSAALSGLGTVARREGDFPQARRLLTEAIEIRRRVSRPLHAARMLISLGSVCYEQGDARAAQRTWEEAVPLLEEADDVLGLAAVISNLGNIYFDGGDHDRAEASYGRAMEIYERVGARSAFTTAMTNLANVIYRRGRLDEAEALHERALVIHREIGDHTGIPQSLVPLQSIALDRGEYERSTELGRQVLDMAEAAGPMLVTDAIVGLATVAHVTGDPARASTLLGAVHAWRARLGAQAVEEKRRSEQALERQLREVLGPRFETAYRAGRELSDTQAIECARDVMHAGDAQGAVGRPV